MMAMRKWRWWLLAMASVLWFGCLVADPYTAWGIEHEEVRPSVARLSAQFATMSLVLITVAGLAAYWKQNSRWDGREMVPGTESNWPAKHPIISYFLRQDDPIYPRKNQPTSFVAWFDAGSGDRPRRNVYFRR